MLTSKEANTVKKNCYASALIRKLFTSVPLERKLLHCIMKVFISFLLMMLGSFLSSFQSFFDYIFIYRCSEKMRKKQDKVISLTVKFCFGAFHVNAYKRRKQNINYIIKLL